MIWLLVGADVTVALWLLWSVPRQTRPNREPVIIVAAVLLAISLTLGVLAAT